MHTTTGNYYTDIATMKRRLTVAGGANDNRQISEEPCDAKVSSTVLSRRESRVFFVTGRLVPFPETLFSPLPRKRVSDPAYADSK